jgi:hypothetical protein
MGLEGTTSDLNTVSFLCAPYIRCIKWTHGRVGYCSKFRLRSYWPNLHEIWQWSPVPKIVKINSDSYRSHVSLLFMKLKSNFIDFHWKVSTYENVTRNIKYTSYCDLNFYFCALEIRNAYKILLRKFERKRLLGRPKRRCEDNKRMCL